MIDSDNVLLLRPAVPTSGVSPQNTKRSPMGSDEVPTSFVVATIYYFEGPVAPDLINFFEHTLKPMVATLGATVSVYFVTENSENTSQLCRCVRARMSLSGSRSFQNSMAHGNYVAALSQSERWRGEISDGPGRYLDRGSEVLKLSPTARSQLRG